MKSYFMPLNLCKSKRRHDESFTLNHQIHLHLVQVYNSSSMVYKCLSKLKLHFIKPLDLPVNLFLI